ncbi:hypothetical protein F1650_07980 [Bacillus velezensis]|nr:hypothetical protein [Bacillus velezensis]
MVRSCVKERIRMNVTSIHPDQWGSQCSISLYSNRNIITRVKKEIIGMFSASSVPGAGNGK